MYLITIFTNKVLGFDEEVIKLLSQYGFNSVAVFDDLGTPNKADYLTSIVAKFLSASLSMSIRSCIQYLFL